MTKKTIKGAASTVRKTLEDWEAVPNTNPLCDDIDDAARKLGYVFDRSKTAETAAILCGQPGMGKSEAIRQALGAAGLKGLFFKHGDQRQLLDAFEMAHRTRQPLILEEADNVLKNSQGSPSWYLVGISGMHDKRIHFSHFLMKQSNSIPIGIIRTK